ncbi:hypothetical protein [Pontibacter virosus]|uniref:Uncharacterized protein n=1 Tax=Pontibacter virosus TaxID=1765052 RepID=A0A2U1B3J8_9BACT|nr:hypothetical protein [Pontibacter virosus]PVY43266.1 hypothetical protein C8E01_102445 [Pontibacter virosus]
MRKHISNPPQESLFGQEQTKDTKLSEFLKAVPFLTFSDKGLENIAKRFSISVEQLQEHIQAHEAKEGRKNG